MLTQLKHQFDVVNADSDLDRYNLLILPDAIPVDAGLAALQSQDFKTATDRFQAAAEIDPRQVAVWTHMATAYMKLSETSTGADAQAALNQAADAYANADALGPDAGVANNRALLLARLGRFSEAQAEFAKAARIDPAQRPSRPRQPADLLSPEPLDRARSKMRQPESFTKKTALRCRLCIGDATPSSRFHETCVLCVPW